MTYNPLQWTINFFLTAGTPIILVLSFPPYNLSFIIFIAFIPLFYLLFIKKIRFPLLWSYAAGILYYALLLSWTGKFHYLSVPFISTVSGLFYFAAPLWLSGKIIERAGAKAGFFTVPSLWVLSEYLKTKGPLSFAFGIIGYSQHNNPAIIQAADIFGVYGISFIIILVNYLGAYALEYLMKQREINFKKELLIPLSITSSIILAMIIYGQIKLRVRVIEEDLAIHIIQTDHDNKGPWIEHMDSYLREYGDALTSLAGKGFDLAVLPENSVKTYLSLDRDFQPDKSVQILNSLSSLAKANNISLLFGGLEADKNEGRINTYNTAFLFDRQGNLSGRYRKRVLVPFGEVNPFGELLPQVDVILLRDTGAIRLTAGSNEKIMKITGRNGSEYRFGVAICFEGTGGGLLRGYALKGADFIVNITSDRWTQSKTALEQHALFGVFRAIEYRLAYYRCGNGGISSVIDPLGRIVKELTPFKKETMESRLLRLKDYDITLYALYGDWIIYLCMAFVIITVIKIKKRRGSGG